MSETQAVNTNQRSNLYSLKSDKEKLTELRKHKDNNSVFERGKILSDHLTNEYSAKGAAKGAAIGAVTGGLALGISTAGASVVPGAILGGAVGAMPGSMIGAKKGEEAAQKEVSLLEKDPNYCTHVEKEYGLCE